LLQKECTLAFHRLNKAKRTSAIYNSFDMDTKSCIRFFWREKFFQRSNIKNRRHNQTFCLLFFSGNMLHNIVIITLKGGVVKYKRDFLYPVVKAQMLAGLFITQMKITKREMQHTLSYVEVEKIAVTIVDDDELDLACICFHDISDGWEFGQLLATQVLLKYVEANNGRSLMNGRASSGPLMMTLGSNASIRGPINGTNNNNNTNNNTSSSSSSSNNNNNKLTTPLGLAASPTSTVPKIEYTIDQSAFHSKLSDAFKSMTLPIMYSLQQQRGIEKAAFVSAYNSNNKVLTSIFADWNMEAFLGHLISTSNDLMGGSPHSIVIEGDVTNVQVIQVAPTYHLVCYVLKSIDPKIIEAAINKAVKLLKQVHDLLTHTLSVK
jgi:hypothetical protein